MSNFLFHRVLAMYKLSVIFLQLGLRYRTGATQEPRYAPLTGDRHRHSGIHPRNRPRTRILMDFSLTPELQELQQRTRAFIRDKIIPLEGDSRQTHHGPTEEFRQRTGGAGRGRGLVAPHVGAEYGGLGLSHVGKAVVFEEAGYSLLGPVAMHIFAPDEGNMHLMEAVASTEQKDRWLRPLASGETRSCFCMTEPAPGAGSDPAAMLTTAVKDGNHYVINGDKWFITGAAAPLRHHHGERRGRPRHHVPGRYGYARHRDRPRDGQSRQAFAGGHAVVQINNVRVPAGDILGEPGKGFRYAQVRLAPARLTHCMRWLGAARRAHDIATDYARKREVFGAKLIGHEGVGFMLADNEIDIRMSRLSILHTAWCGSGGARRRRNHRWRRCFVSEAVLRVVDRCVQVFGGQGVTGETLVARLFNEVRGFRFMMVRPRCIAGAWRNGLPATERTGEQKRPVRARVPRACDSPSAGGCAVSCLGATAREKMLVTWIGCTHPSPASACRPSVSGWAPEPAPVRPTGLAPDAGRPSGPPSSRPIERRITPSVMPSRARSSSPMRMCVVVAGWVASDFESPRLFDTAISWNPFMTGNAPSFPPATSKVTTVPPPVICFSASACCGWSARVGYQTRTAGCSARKSAIAAAAARRIDPQRQSFHALEQHPGVEWRQRRAGVADERLQHLVDPLLAAEHRAAQHAALPVHVLGAGVDYNIGAQFQRLLQQWRGEDIVNHDDRAGGMSQFGNCRQVHQFQHRIGRRFQQHEIGRTRQRLPPLSKVGTIDEFRLDPEFRQQRGDDPVAGPEQRARRTTRSPVFRCDSSAAFTAAIPVAVVRQSSAPSIRQSRCSSMLNVGIGEAGILVVFDRSGEGRLGLFGVVIDVARSQI